MNLKLCKALRRKAIGETVGKPMRRLIDWKQTVSQRKGGGFVIGLINDPTSTRGVYRALKRAA